VEKQKDSTPEQREEFLIILDDVVGEIDLQSKASIMVKLLTKGRHINLSLIIALHAFKTL
jgi:ABC-type dipeptide/oligopeptide/nickel transport system ATPase subunit